MDLDWINLAQIKDQYRAAVNTVFSFRVLAERLVASQKTLCPWIYLFICLFTAAC